MVKCLKKELHMAKRKKKRQDIHLGHYAVAFIDLLGQQEFLRSLSLPIPETPENYEATKEQLANTYGAVTRMRKWFDDSFAVFARRNIPSWLSPDQLREFKTLTNNPIQYQAFSDSISIFMALRTRTAKLPIRGIFGILGASACTFTCCLATGHPIRGGIDIGLGIDITKNEVYGPALARAYALESKIADYPRIVIGTELMNYIITTRDQPPTDTTAIIAKGIAEKCLACITEDDDGYLIIDHLGENYRQIFGEVINANVIKQAYGKVLNFHATFQENKKLAERYSRLKKYYDTRLPIWEDLFTA